MENNIVNQEKKKAVITREMITKGDGTLDITVVRNLLKRGTRLGELPLTVAFYDRVSTAFEAHMKCLDKRREYYENMINEIPNWNLYKGYVDEGRYGTSVKKSEHFLEMIEDAVNHKFDLIITRDISRFSCSVVATLEYTRKLLAYGVGVWFEDNNTLTFDPDSEFLLETMASIAQEVSRKSFMRMKFGVKEAIKSGKVLGNSNIYGYNKCEGKLVIDENEAEMIHLIYDLYANKYHSLCKIARILYDNGYRNHNGNRISETTIKRIITNPKYKGFYCGGKTTKFSHLGSAVMKIPKEEWVMYKDESGETVPAIVSEELWERANRRFQ